MFKIQRCTIYLHFSQVPIFGPSAIIRLSQCPELYENNAYKDLISSDGLEISFLHKNLIKHKLKYDVKLDEKQ